MDIDKLIAKARKNQNKEELSVLQLIKSEFSKAVHNGIKLDELSKINILLKMASQRREDCKIYLENGRKDLAEEEKIELSYINQFIPKIPNKEEIILETSLVISKLIKIYDAPITMRNTKEIIQLVKNKYPTANSKTITEFIKEFINDNK